MVGDVKAEVLFILELFGGNPEVVVEPETLQEVALAHEAGLPDPVAANHPVLPELVVSLVVPGLGELPGEGGDPLVDDAAQGAALGPLGKVGSIEKSALSHHVINSHSVFQCLLENHSHASI